MKVLKMEPEAHDEALGFTSHLPHAVAFSLKRSLPTKYKALCAGGFRDTTRVAASNAQLWAGIFLSNRGCLLKSLKVFERNLSDLKAAVARGDHEALVDILAEAKEV